MKPQDTARPPQAMKAGAPERDAVAKAKCPPLYVVAGRVVHERGIGKLVGMPTANLELPPGTALPPSGVYAAWAVLDGGSVYGAVVHIGARPTVDRDGFAAVEAHLLDFDREIYGRKLELRLLAWLREVRRFEEFSLLLAQVRADCAAARIRLGLEPPQAQLRLDAGTRCVWVGGSRVELSQKEFALLNILCVNPDAVFTKERLYELVWCQPSNGFCHAVENTVFQIRKKLRAHGVERQIIRTVVGKGYRLETEEK